MIESPKCTTCPAARGTGRGRSPWPRPRPADPSGRDRLQTADRYGDENRPGDEQHTARVVHDLVFLTANVGGFPHHRARPAFITPTGHPRAIRLSVLQLHNDRGQRREATGSTGEDNLAEGLAQFVPVLRVLQVQVLEVLRQTLGQTRCRTSGDGSGKRPVTAVRRSKPKQAET